MAAADYTITIDAGATWNLTVIYKDSAGVPVDLTAYLARMQVRKRSRAPGAPLVSLTESSGIAIDPLNGRLDLSIDAPTTRLLPEGEWAYDIEIEAPGGIITRLLYGKAVVRAEVTR